MGSRVRAARKPGEFPESATSSLAPSPKVKAIAPLPGAAEVIGAACALTTLVHDSENVPFTPASSLARLVSR